MGHVRSATSKATAHPGLPCASASAYDQNILQTYRTKIARENDSKNGAVERSEIEPTSPRRKRIPNVQNQPLLLLALPYTRLFQYAVPQFGQLLRLVSNPRLHFEQIGIILEIMLRLHFYLQARTPQFQTIEKFVKLPK
jgi:hypothetical protein